jgi:CRP-like cAMP-binding protein
MKLSIKKYARGAFIYLEGNNRPREFYIVKTGHIKIIRTNPIIGEVEDSRTVGYIFGMVQCLTGIPVEETVQAATDCEIFVVERSKLEFVFQEHPKILFKILSEYSEILRKLDNDLVKYDFFVNESNRESKVFEIADIFMTLDKGLKAAQLLTSYLREKSVDDDGRYRAEQLLSNLPKIDFYEPDDLITEHTFDENSVIFTEYEKADCFFIIKQGRVKITKLKHDQELLIAVLSDGDIFGEMAILNDKPRNATAEAVDSTTVMVIDKTSIYNLPQKLFIRVLEFISRRIWMVQQQLISYKLPMSVAKIYFLLCAKVRQVIPNPEDEYEKSFTFKFPVKELYQMLGLDFSQQVKVETAEFLNDDNIGFFRDSIEIRKLEKLFDRNAYHFSRAAHTFKSLQSDI